MALPHTNKLGGMRGWWCYEGLRVSLTPAGPSQAGGSQTGCGRTGGLYWDTGGQSPASVLRGGLQDLPPRAGKTSSEVGATRSPDPFVWRVVSRVVPSGRESGVPWG